MKIKLPLLAALVLSIIVLYSIPRGAFAQESSNAPAAVEAAPATAAPAMPPSGPGPMGGKGPMVRPPVPGSCMKMGMGCCQGMGMGSGMGMGMGGMGMMDPKTRGGMMQMRGKMMVEMGNWMIKRGKEVEQQQK